MENAIISSILLFYYTSFIPNLYFKSFVQTLSFIKKKIWKIFYYAIVINQ